MNHNIRAKVLEDWFLIVAFVILSGLLGCGEGGRLSSTAKSNFFTDRRGFDPKIINEDVKRLTDAISSNPDNAQFFVSRGFIYAALNKYSSAISDFKKAEKINVSVATVAPYAPAKNGVHYLLALAYWQKGNFKEAIKYFSKVIAKNPQHQKSHEYMKIVSQKLKGKNYQGRTFATYVMCFLSNEPPQLRPFGYVWEIRHAVR